MIGKRIKEAMNLSAMDDDEEFKESCLRILLIFEFNQPDLGYVPGMEVLVMFLRKLESEVETFITFFNIVFSYPAIWSIYSQDHIQLKIYLNILDQLCKKLPERKLVYEVNRQHLEKFFVEEGSTLFVGVFEPSVIE